MIDIRHRIPSGHSGRFTIPNLDEVEGIAVHHSVSGWVWNPETRKYTCRWNDAVDVSQEVEVAHLLAIDRWHSLPNNDWGGFGYHVAAFASGRWYYVGSLNTARAHVVGLNKRFNGLVLIGDFTSTVPCESHLAGAKEGVTFIREFHGRIPVEAHRLIRNQATTCPGKTWPQWGPKLEEEPMEIQDDFAALRELEGAFMSIPEEAHQVRRRHQMATLAAIRHSQHESPEVEMARWKTLNVAYENEIRAIREAQERCRVHGRPG